MSESRISDAAAVHRVEKPALRIRDYVQILVVTILVALFLKTFIIEAYRIPSGSMEYTLRSGDFLLANKFIYGVQTPRRVPFTGVTLPHVRLPGWNQPQRGDVVVFELPAYAYEQALLETTNYVKRCMALPGDTLAIVNRKVFINGAHIALPGFVKPSNRRMYPKDFGDSRIFPMGTKFNEDNYGPLAVPKQGDMVKLDATTFFYFRDIIAYEGHNARLDENKNVLIDGVAQDVYEVKLNYYFMMGDNRDNSLDSRFWGFVPEDLIIGKVMLIYWSWDEDNLDDGFFSRLKSVRWNRVGTIVR